MHSLTFPQQFKAIAGQDVVRQVVNFCCAQGSHLLLFLPLLDGGSVCSSL